MSTDYGFDFASVMRYELKRAERYRIFLSLVVFNIGPIVDLAGEHARNETMRSRLISDLLKVINAGSREIDFVSNSGRTKIGLLLPETSRQGAESATSRIVESLSKFCTDYFSQSDEYMVPVEISSFPDASGTRSISSYIEDFASVN